MVKLSIFFQANFQLQSNLYALLKKQYDMNSVVKLSDNAVSYAVELLREGEVIALPTDTVYGLAVNSSNSKAISKLYEIKGRDFKKPIAICVANVYDIEKWGNTDDIPSFLLNELLPGPVTILLKRTHLLSNKLNPGVDKVGIRIPKSNFVCKVAKSLGLAIALTSANSSNEPSTLSPNEFQHLWPKLGGIFSSGVLGDSKGNRSGSTIVDLTVSGKFVITREGSALESTLKILKKYGLEQCS